MILTTLKTCICEKKEYNEPRKIKIAGMFGWFSHYFLYCCDNATNNQEKSTLHTFLFMTPYTVKEKTGDFWNNITISGLLLLVVHHISAFSVPSY